MPLQDPSTCQPPSSCSPLVARLLKASRQLSTRRWPLRTGTRPPLRHSRILPAQIPPTKRTLSLTEEGLQKTRSDLLCSCRIISSVLNEVLKPAFVGKSSHQSINTVFIYLCKTNGLYKPVRRSRKCLQTTEVIEGFLFISRLDVVFPAVT
ncbi:hypothetical protein ILYODFUR_011384 [Ilyodon furcidens]|uniref:Uncharacterized protein n=1 Tax=Ilyodon furcidens TaxID=33524 RepID=A0ABV0TTS1_9TELE